MRYLDANIFLRFLVRPVTPADQVRAEACRALFERLRDATETATTSEAVLAEVAYVLVSPRQYALSAADVSVRLKPLVALPGLKLAHKRRFLRALDLFATHPKLDFEDALSSAIVERLPARELYSYDCDFDAVVGITRVEPETV